jgi:hypothetical protein
MRPDFFNAEPIKILPKEQQEALAKWILNIERHPNHTHPVLWIVRNRGEGHISELVKFLMLSSPAFIRNEFLTNRFCSDRFALRHCQFKDLLVFNDCKSPKFINSDYLHSIIRGDYLEIEIQQQEPFTAYLKAAVIVVANCEPDETREPILKIVLP